MFLMGHCATFLRACWVFMRFALFGSEPKKETKGSHIHFTTFPSVLRVIQYDLFISFQFFVCSFILHTAAPLSNARSKI